MLASNPILELPGPVGNGWIFIIGNWMIKYVNGRDVFRNNSAKMTSYSGARTDNLLCPIT